MYRWCAVYRLWQRCPWKIEVAVRRRRGLASASTVSTVESAARREKGAYDWLSGQRETRGVLTDRVHEGRMSPVIPSIR